MEIKPMKVDIEKAIKTLLDKVTASTNPGDLLKITQSALNLAHTQSTLGVSDSTK